MLGSRLDVMWGDVGDSGRPHTALGREDRESRVGSESATQNSRLGTHQPMSSCLAVTSCDIIFAPTDVVIVLIL